LQTIASSDVVTTFVSGQEVFAFVNCGNAQPNVDFFDLTVVANRTSQSPVQAIAPSADGFVIVSLGTLAVANYILEVRYKGELVKQAEFRVIPRPTPVPPRPTLRSIPLPPISQPQQPITQATPTPLLVPPPPLVITPAR
jgi:hypothetical protein